MTKLVNRAKMTTATTGTGSITLGSAVDGYQTFAAAGVADGDIVRYVIEDGTSWEIGSGTYTASGTTMSRSVEESSNADAAISLSGEAVVFVSAVAADLVQTGPSMTAVASGALANGDKVVVNADGTVSVVAGGSATKTLGATAAISNIDTFGIAYDTANKKIVVVYEDRSNGYYGTAVVGTVSGTTISFGSPVVFASVVVDRIVASYNASSGKIVVTGYAGSYGYIVGTVSGNTISFGSWTAEASMLRYNVIHQYDSASGNTVFIGGNGSFYPSGLVASVSGNTLTFGTPVVFLSSSLSTIGDYASTYDADNNTVVTCFKHPLDNSYTYANVATITGTSISFGTNQRLKTNTLKHATVYYDTSEGVIVLTYDNGTSYGRVETYSISGASFTQVGFTSGLIGSANQVKVSSFDTIANKGIVYMNGYIYPIIVSGAAVTAETGTSVSASGVSYLGCVYDPYQNVTIVSDSFLDAAVAFENDYSFTNITAENYIGISDGAYSDSETATIQLVGSVDDAQSGLTAGQAYYVQGDGTLALTPDTTSVFAGTAVSATKLIVKG